MSVGRRAHVAYLPRTGHIGSRRRRREPTELSSVGQVDRQARRDLAVKEPVRRPKMGQM